MITKEQILELASYELTPIGWHEEHAKYIDGLDTFAEKLIELLHNHTEQPCICKYFTRLGKMFVCRECGKEHKSLSI